MGTLDDNIEDLDPSTDPTLDETGATGTPDAASEAKSSPATGENEDTDLLSVVRDAVKESRDVSQSASPAEGEEGSEAEGAGAKKQDDEEFSDAPFHKHPRFQQLLRQRNSFRQDAQRYNNVQTFLDDAGLSAEEAADGLSIMGLAKTDPAQAWQKIKPWVQQILVAAGEVLPDDLNGRVQNGEMSREAAIELSRARAAQANSAAAQSFRAQQAEKRQQAQTVSTLQTTALEWENARREKDPNFDAKYEDVMKEVSWLIQKEGRPTDAAGVKAQLQKAYKAVNDRVRPAAPAPRAKPAIRPLPGGQVAGGQPTPQNMSTLDIVRANRRVG